MLFQSKFPYQEESAHGRWVSYGMSERWRVCRYDPGGHFAPHMDGDYRKAEFDRSLQTVQLYLNDEFDAGGINFVRRGAGCNRDDKGRMCADQDNVLVSWTMLVAFDREPN